MKKQNPIQNQELKARPPIVVVLGHVDHGKTTILDFIKKSQVAQGEAGGITQHIGAYQIQHQGKAITFLDTPGHEAFSAMRSRGAKVADIALLVVASDEGIRPQTIEAINHIKKANLPLIVVLNKADRISSPNQPEIIKHQLVKEGMTVESLGGKVPSVLVSAKTGQGIDELLEVILLLAEIEEIKTRLAGPGQGVVIESHLDSKRGPTATLLLLEGQLQKKDFILTQSTRGTIKTLEDWQGKSLQQAEAGMPILICGLEAVPVLGEKFEVLKDPAASQAQIQNYLAAKQRKRRQEAEILDIGEGKKALNLILKTDVAGSIEAIREMLRTIPQDEVVLRILKAEAGPINETDIKLASSAGAKIVGFHAKISPALKELAQRQKVTVMVFEIIYELVQAVRDLAAKYLAPEIVREKLAQLRVLAVFKTKPPRQIVGGKITEGKVQKPARIEIWRNEEKIGEGRLLELQRDKKEVEAVEKGKEAGILFEGDAIIEEADTLIFFREVKQKREL